MARRVGDDYGVETIIRKKGRLAGGGMFIITICKFCKGKQGDLVVLVLI